MTPLATIGEAVKALRSRLNAVETHSKSIEEGVVDVFATYHDHIKDLYTEVDDLKSVNQKLQAQVQEQEAAIIQIFEVVEALKSA